MPARRIDRIGASIGLAATGTISTPPGFLAVTWFATAIWADGELAARTGDSQRVVEEVGLGARSADELRIGSAGGGGGGEGGRDQHQLVGVDRSVAGAAAGGEGQGGHGERSQGGGGGRARARH